jgi:CheY-like chemotaxis protein/DNA-binding XRE family transcriptional regulator
MTRANVKKEFGAAVRAFRQQMGISQETLAERAELHRTYITDVERGARNISLESISRLAHAMGLSISSLFPPPSSSDLERGASRAPVQSTVDILLVEDDPKDVELTVQAFKGARLSNRVDIVSDGQAALDFLFCQGPFARRVDIADHDRVVLLDLHLPKLHGLEVLKRLRTDQRTRALRVVVLTNSRDNDHVREALQLGAVAYIVKPLDFQSFSSVTPQLNFSWTLLSSPGQPRTVKASARRDLKA